MAASIYSYARPIAGGRMDRDREPGAGVVKAQEQRADMEQSARLVQAVQEADAAIVEAHRTLEQLAKEMGFPLASSWRPEERHGT